MTREQVKKAAALRWMGFTVGERDPRLNTAFLGCFMVVEAHDDSELPTESGADGPWCIVGNDLGELIDTAYSCWADERG